MAFGLPGPPGPGKRAGPDGRREATLVSKHPTRGREADVLTLEIETRGRDQFIDITPAVQQALDQAGFSAGAVVVYSPHTTAGVTVNEHADPAVAADLLPRTVSTGWWHGRIGTTVTARAIRPAMSRPA